MLNACGHLVYILLIFDVVNIVNEFCQLDSIPDKPQVARSTKLSC